MVIQAQNLADAANEEESPSKATTNLVCSKKHVEKNKDFFSEKFNVLTIIKK